MKRKLSVFFIFLLISIIFIPNKIVYADNIDNAYYLGGIPAGFTISERGAKIVNLCDVLTENGLKSPAKECQLNTNDYIMNIDGNEVNSASDISKYVKNSNELVLQIKREEEILLKKLVPVKDIYGNYKLGVIIADDLNGIGTITYFNNGRFASLGHAIYNDEKEIYKLNQGEIFEAQITGVVKGRTDKAGELKGIFFKDRKMGDIEKNLISGNYGNTIKNFDYTKFQKIELGNAEIGNAEIYTTVCGKEPKNYSIQIVKKDSLFKNEKNLVIKITDEDLLKTTNGIVQGMSGSPIVQNGKLVGAVTHVFINDSTRGYGIKIQDMINN